MQNFIVSMYISIFIAVLSIFILYKINIKNNTKILNTKTEQNNIFNLSIYLSITSNEQILNEFKNILSSHHQVTTHTNYLQISHNNNKVFLFTHFKNQVFTLFDLLQIYDVIQKNNLTNVIICTHSIENIDSKFLFILKEKNIKLFDIYKTYKLIYKDNNYFPQINYIQQLSKKQKYKDLSYVVFNKSKTKSYFLCGIFLLISSLFTPYNLYYVISSSLLFLLAIYCYFNKPFNIKSKLSLFDD